MNSYKSIRNYILDMDKLIKYDPSLLVTAWKMLILMVR